jgi:hypothetical protein
MTIRTGDAMTTIAIVPEAPGFPATTYRAVAGKVQAVGNTAGQALDALTLQLGEAQTGTLVVIQHCRPDQFFTEAQQQRLEQLMSAWHAARQAGQTLPAQDQAELETLVEAEVGAAAARAKTLIQGLVP